MTTIKRPDEALSALGALYRERNGLYGDTYKDFGRVMRGFFPAAVTLDSEAAWNRMALYFHMADKMARYARTFEKGGHPDSLDDVSVYAQLLQECDAEVRAERPSKKLPGTMKMTPHVRTKDGTTERLWVNEYGIGEWRPGAAETDAEDRRVPKYTTLKETWNDAVDAAKMAIEKAPVFPSNSSGEQVEERLRTLSACRDAVEKLRQP